MLKHYFSEHPEYYERMVTAYVIGLSVTQDDLDAYPHLKFATGESDTGVIVSWNTEGPKNVAENAHNVVVLPGVISINPINWKLDETYAPASENLGSLMLNEETYEYEITDFFGPQSFHEDDYTLYFNNLKANVAKRVAAYMVGQ